jgi:hypothetical protein
MEVFGKIKTIGAPVQVSEKFVKREMSLTTDEQYPQVLGIQFVQDKCDLLNNFSVGDNVKIGINLRGREWENKHGEIVVFNTLQGWVINELKEEAGKPAEVHDAKVFKIDDKEEDDLPF